MTHDHGDFEDGLGHYPTLYMCIYIYIYDRVLFRLILKLRGILPLMNVGFVIAFFGRIL